MLRLIPTDPAETPDPSLDRALAEELQDRQRRDERTARALRTYLVEHPRGDRS